MLHWAFLAGFLLVGCFVLFNGVLMSVAPAKHRQFLSWWGQEENRGEAEPPPAGAEIGRRLAGIGLAAIGVFMTIPVLKRVAENLSQRPIGDWIFPIFSGSAFCYLESLYSSNPMR
jgi:hypothetical protein